MGDLVLLVLLAGAAASARWLLRDLRTLACPDPDAEAEAEAEADARAAASVAVVVPARDEEATLPDLLASLRRLAHPVAEVVVVDDASSDATADVARRGGARVLPATDRPSGWTGKAWACHLGARASGSDLLLFLDADTVLEPDALRGLLALHERHGGLVSVQPFHRVVRTYENLSSYFNVVSVMASAAFVAHPGPRSMAFGPCLLTSRADYDRAGGHAAVRGEILDDVQLAAAYHRADLPVRCAVGAGSVRMRSYPGGLRQLCDGWTKNVASGASATAPGPFLGAVAWVSAHHAVGLGGVLALLDVAAAPTSGPAYGALGLWALVWAGVAVHLRWALGRVGAFRWWTWALFPVPLLAFDALFLRSTVLSAVRRSVRWRGRPVDLRRAG